jgi:alkylation response protein AidB-like acyl-CoA dehydrogenase
MISFALTEDQNIAQAAAADFAAKFARPAARAADESSALQDSLLTRAWALGLVQSAASAETPEQPSVLNALVLEEIAHGDAALALAMAAPLGFVKAIAESGSPNQKQTYLPHFMTEAPVFAAIAHTDAGWFGGAGQPTRARRTENGWRLEGAKALVPLANRCKYFLVTAETGDGTGSFVVSASLPGVHIDAPKGSLGLRALNMSDVVFNAVEVSAEARLPGDLRRCLDLSRVALSAILSGLARAVYEFALPYTKERVVHGEAIARKQAVAFRLADMHIAAQAMRWMTLRAASELDAHPKAVRTASLARRYAAENGLKIADEGVQLFGGHGYVREMPLEMWYRNARTLSVLDGLVGV